MVIWNLDFSLKFWHPYRIFNELFLYINCKYVIRAIIVNAIIVKAIIFNCKGNSQPSVYYYHQVGKYL